MIRNKVSTCVLMSVLGMGAVYGDPVATNTLAVLNFQIAKEGITRISVENDEIDDVYVYPFQFTDNVKLHKTGQLFVVADNMNQPVHLTVITKRGVTQDLRIKSGHKHPEPIVLKPVAEKKKPEDEVEQINLILEKFIRGIQPGGFYRVDIKETSRSLGSISCIVENSYQKAPYRVVIYKVKNETNQPVTLDNKLFWIEGDVALAFDRLQIAPCETAKLYVIQKI